MNRKIKVVGLTLGDPFSRASRSGVNYSIFSRIREKCELLDVFDLDLKGAQKILSALMSFSPNRRRWSNKLHQSPRAFRIRTLMAQKILSEVPSGYDLIYQDGAMFMPGKQPAVPFVSYHDSNVILSVRGGPFAHGAHYHGRSFQETLDQERIVYEKAALIFTMSDWLRDSMIRDFGISEEKVVTVYAGTNLASENFDKKYDGKTILFVGNNFERKGGSVLLEAFKIVRKEIKDAKLIIVGPELNLNEEGIVIKGNMSDKEELAQCFRNASLFVLPSFYEPFGIVFAEAFAFKNPCIGSNTCAMPEIIEEGKGGFLVPKGDSKILADRMISLLKDENLSRRMGSYGYEKARTIFNWDVVVDKMIAHSMRVIG